MKTEYSTESEEFVEKIPKTHDANPGRHHDSGASAVPLCSTRGPKKRPQGSGVASKWPGVTSYQLELLCELISRYGMVWFTSVVSHGLQFLTGFFRQKKRAVTGYRVSIDRSIQSSVGGFGHLTLRLLGVITASLLDRSFLLVPNVQWLEDRTNHGLTYWGVLNHYTVLYTGRMKVMLVEHHKM